MPSGREAKSGNRTRAVGTVRVARDRLAANWSAACMAAALGIAAMWLLSGCATQNVPAGVTANYDIKRLADLPKVNDPDPDPDPAQDLPELSAAEHERLGDNLFQTGNLERAFIQYDKALRKNPEEVRLYYKRGLLYLTKGMFDQAMRDFQTVLDREPGHGLAAEGMGHALFKMNRHEEAERYFVTALQNDSRLWVSHNFLGILFDYKGQPERAVSEFQAAIALRPNEGSLYNNLGVAYSLMGEYEKAARAFNDALRNKATGKRASNNLGLVLSRLGRPEEAVEAFKRAGDEAQAYNNLGCMYLQQGDYDKAVQAFETALGLRHTYYAQAAENLNKAQMSLYSRGSLDADSKRQ